MKKLLFLFILLTQVAAAQSPVYKDTTSGKYDVLTPPVIEPVYGWTAYIEFLDQLKFVAAQSPVYKDTTFGKFGVVHPITAEPITEFEYDWAAPVYLNDTLVRVRKAGLTGIISINGRVAVPVEFDNIQDALAGAEYGIVSVAKGGHWGLWDAKKGRSVLPLEFEYVRAIYPDLLVGRRNGSSFLEFFDENAQKLFERVGSAAGPSFAPHTIQIMVNNGELQ